MSLNIKKVLLLTLFIGSFYSSSQTPSFSLDEFLTSDPTQICPSARQISLGKTYAVDMQDASSVFLNPAGLAVIKDKTISSMYTNITDDVNYLAFAYAHPTKIGTIGVGLLRLGVDTIYKTSEDANGDGIIDSSFDYLNNLFFFSLARKLNPRAAFGLTLKYAEQNFQNITNGKVASLGLDIGGAFKLTHKIRLGFAAKNALGGGNEHLKKQLKIGFNFQILDNLGSTLDVKLEEFYPLTLQAGLEWKPLDFIALRTGFEEAFAAINKKVLNYSLGLGLKFAGITFDYAYYIDNELDYNNRSYFSLGFVVK